MHRRRWQSAAARRLLALAGDVQSIEEAVDLIVERLLEGTHSYPTNLTVVAHKVSAEIKFDKTLVGSGGLERLGMGYRILCSPEQPPTRQRFTIAHEIAHIVFQETGPHCPRRGRELERLCDMISAALLIPKDVFNAGVKPRLSLADLSDLARRCEVSLAMTLIRAAEMRENCSIGYIVDEDDEEVIAGGDMHWIKRNAPEAYKQLWELGTDRREGRTLLPISTSSLKGEFLLEWSTMGPLFRHVILLQRLDAT